MRKRKRVFLIVGISLLFILCLALFIRSRIPKQPETYTVTVPDQVVEVSVRPWNLDKYAYSYTDPDVIARFVDHISQVEATVSKHTPAEYAGSSSWHILLISEQGEYSEYIFATSNMLKQNDGPWCEISYEQLCSVGILADQCTPDIMPQEVFMWTLSDEERTW